MGIGIYDLNECSSLALNIENVGMCFDMGHAYCYDSEYRLIEKYKDKIMCTHLHNNYKSDTHNSLFDGEINVKQGISMIDENKLVDNCLEVFPPRGSNLNKEEFIDFVKRNFDDYCKCID